MRNLLRIFLKSLVITLVYLSFGLSLGCYYTATYFGVDGWPLPSYEAISGAILYYFSVINARTEVQAVHWMVTFFVTGYLWIAALSYTSSRFARNRPSPENPVAETVSRFATLGFPVALATIPVSLPIPFMIWWMGSTSDGFSWSHFIAVCLRRASVSPRTSLNFVYLGLAAVSLIAQSVIVHKRLNAGWSRSFGTIALAFGMLIVVAICAGILVSYPLQAILE